MKKTIIILILNLSFLILNCLGQSQFEVAIGGNSDEVAYSIIQTMDGGYAAAGYTTSFGAGSNDFYIVKLNRYGTLQWTKTVGGFVNEIAYCIIQTTDGGYAVAGYTASFGAGNYDMYIVKLNGNGTVLWSKTVGGTINDYCNSIIQTTDGGHALAGYTNSFGAGYYYDMYIVKLDVNGIFQWSKTVGGTGQDYANSIIQTSDGGYAVAGYTNSFGAGNYDAYIVKLSGNGNLQWSRTVGDTTANYANSIIQTTDGGYAIAGMFYYNQPYIIKMDLNGSLQWAKTSGGTDGYWAYSIIQTTDGGYAIGGGREHTVTLAHYIYLLKVNANGDFQWGRSFSGNYAYSICFGSDGGYALAGEVSPTPSGYKNIKIIKTDWNGNICNYSGGSPFLYSRGVLNLSETILNSQSSIVTSAISTTMSGGTITTYCSVGIQPISNEIPSQFQLYQNYPNPFNPTTKIKFALPKSSFAMLVVYDALGRELETLVNEQLNAGTYEADWSADKFSSGVFYYKLTAHQGGSSSGDFVETRKMVLVK